jgi:CBS domain-containing protein
MKAKVKDIMCANPKSCSPHATLHEAAQMMAECDCGAIPVVESDGTHRAIGVITDRDIACRAVAKGLSPETHVHQVMSSRLSTIGEDDSVEDCCNQMERAQLRRLMVVNGDGELCGVVSQADIALHLSGKKIAEVVKEVSQPSKESSAIA